jgi:hypothetical protein
MCLPGVPVSLTECTTNNLHTHTHTHTHIYIYTHLLAACLSMYTYETQITISVWMGIVRDVEVQHTIIGHMMQFELPEKSLL